MFLVAIQKTFLTKIYSLHLNILGFFFRLLLFGAQIKRARFSQGGCVRTRRTPISYAPVIRYQFLLQPGAFHNSTQPVKEKVLLQRFQAITKP